MDPSQLNWIAGYIWGIADDVLRDLYVRGKYRDVILPMSYHARDLLGRRNEKTERTIKLRFRRNHKQVVRYIGSTECAAVVRAELNVLQAETAILRKLNSTVKKAGQMLRDAKTQLGPLFEANGLAFHGLAVRRPRKPTVDVSVSITES